MVKEKTLGEGGPLVSFPFSCRLSELSSHNKKEILADEWKGSEY